MILQKWNYKKHKYDSYEVPDEWNCCSYSDDMKEIINCPHCGKELEYGKAYTSIEIHTVGCAFGYAVCEECYEKEWNRRRKVKKI